MNDKLILRALRMLKNRADYWQKRGGKTTSAAVAAHANIRASTYQSAYDILHCAILGDEECLRGFDYYDAN